MDDDHDMKNRSIADMLAEFEGVSKDVWSARHLIIGWLAVEMPMSAMLYGLDDVFGDHLPHIATQCTRDNETDKMIRVLSRQRDRLGDNLPKPFFG